MSYQLGELGPAAPCWAGRGVGGAWRPWPHSLFAQAPSAVNLISVQGNSRPPGPAWPGPALRPGRGHLKDTCSLGRGRGCPVLPPGAGCPRSSPVPSFVWPGTVARVWLGDGAGATFSCMYVGAKIKLHQYSGVPCTWAVGRASLCRKSGWAEEGARRPHWQLLGTAWLWQGPRGGWGAQQAGPLSQATSRMAPSSKAEPSQATSRPDPYAQGIPWYTRRPPVHRATPGTASVLSFRA